VISVRDLVKRHGDQTVLKGVSLDVAAGEVAAVIGPSGGGKSTLLRCLNGLEPFEAGTVRVGEHELTPRTHPRRDAGLLQAVRRTVGFVFQQFNLFPHMTALGNLVEAPCRVLGEPREAAEGRALSLLERVGLREKRDALPRSLSGGQQQRVAIARALMMRPKAMLFDEPTSALDPVMAGEVLAVMADLARGGQTMVVVTHSMSFARGVAKEVFVMADGLVVERGAPAKVFEAPQHAVTRSFLRQSGGPNSAQPAQ
jgi:ABC-type polar amino acid transport system ATPase subunit